MTKEQLEACGLVYVGSKLKPRNFILPHVGEVAIPENYTIDDVFGLVYEKGRGAGYTEGQDDFATQLREMLKIPFRD